MLAIFVGVCGRRELLLLSIGSVLYILKTGMSDANMLDTFIPFYMSFQCVLFSSV